MDDMDMREVARRAVVWLRCADPQINIGWGSSDYDDEVTAFLWRHFLEPVAQDIEWYAEKRIAEVVARIEADYSLEESEVTDVAGVPVGEGQ